jgi:branched-chain amino acid transport system ATP-binding protein
MPEMSDAAEPLLSIENVEITYGQAILAVRGISLTLHEGKIVALLGPNGAGKTTTLKAISNLLSAERGQVTRGVVRYRGESIVNLEPAELVARGVVQVLEGRHCFSQLTVEENLVTGAFATKGPRAQAKQDLERVYGYFPRLREKRRTRAGYASGGEQQMTALGRALMARPKLVVLDEPSMGLAPLVVEEIFDIVARLNREEGISFLVAEQNAAIALRHAHTACIIENGRVAMAGRAADLGSRHDVKELYFGLGQQQRGGFRDRRPAPPQFWLH